MRKATWFAVVALVSLAGITGCLPSTKIVKNPGAGDQGVRYYRPKPYLVIKPMVSKDGLPVAGYVTIDQTIMPDYSEEYSIHIRSGVGINNTSIKLADGWNLESLNVELDSQVDDNLQAAAEVLSAVPRLTSQDSGDMSGIPVRATNVPLGYYESVISQGCDGVKRLYGFRYVGFMPYAACPITSGGVDATCCHEGQVYGLVFGAEGMTFKLLHDLPDHTGPVPAAVDLSSSPKRLPGDDAHADAELNPTDSGPLDDAALGSR
ncbi:MAG: hypothetical protein ACO1RT_05220 [Planctomycetaceae bacterium]